MKGLHQGLLVKTINTAQEKTALLTNLVFFGSAIGSKVWVAPCHLIGRALSTVP